MGVYDSVLLPCPKCGTLEEAQSKSGDCLCRVFSFEETTEDVMINVNRHAPFKCLECGTNFKVEFTPEPKIVETDEENDDFPELPDGATVEDFVDAFANYQDKINKK